MKTTTKKTKPKFALCWRFQLQLQKSPDGYKPRKSCTHTRLVCRFAAIDRDATRLRKRVDFWGSPMVQYLLGDVWELNYFGFI